MSAKQPVLILQTVKVSVCTFKQQTVLYRLLLQLYFIKLQKCFKSLSG